MLLGALASVFAAMEARSETTTYVGRHFEVRAHDAPVKYVFDGGTRVARVSGSLSTNERIQRLRLRTGWNLVSLAVTPPDFAGQVEEFTSGPTPVIQALYRWQPATRDYRTIASGESVPAGTVLWISARTNGVVAVRGRYVEPAQWNAPGGEAFVAVPALEAQPLTVPEGVTLWRYDASSGHWQAGLPGNLAALNDLPSVLGPGEAIYVHSNDPVDLGAPASEQRVRYYHQDHIGSSSVMTDATGNLMEETAYYPFGIPRHEHRLRQVDEAYKFTQKERDQESGLHHFEARFLAGGMSRFLSVDPMYANTDASAGDPQAMNLYAYARNNPLLYTDPTGLEPVPDLATIAHNAAVSDTRAASKSDGASFSAGFGDAVLDMFTPNPYIYEGLIGGSRLGPDIRGALGINNVDSDSGYYTAGDVAGTIFTFATGAGEVKTAVKGGTDTAKALIKGGSVAGGEGANVAVRSARSVIDPLADTAAGNARVVSKNAGTFASESGAVARVASANQAAAAQTMQNYRTILDSAQNSLRHLVKSGVHPSKVMDMAFKQADAIYVSKYGLRPPGSF